MLTLCAVLLVLAPVWGSDVDEYIVGGKEVHPPGTWPWQGVLYYSGSLTCGCVVIDERHVLTAAHCVEGVMGGYEVRLGVHDRTTELDGQPEYFSLIEIVQHEDFVNAAPLGFPNDVAIMTVDRVIDFEANPFIEPALMAASGNESDVDFAGSNCYITGWGRLTGSGTLPNILREANIDVITNEVCTEKWVGITATVLYSHICVFDVPRESKGACNGDSGGALVCHADDEWVLAGLTSWGISGCGTDYPSVYSRVSSFREWFDDQMPE